MQRRASSPQSGAQPDDRRAGRLRTILIGLTLLTTALTTRLAFLTASPDRHWPHSVCYEGDAALWARYANHLQRGVPFEWNLPIHTPAMGYLLLWTGAADPTNGFCGHKVAWCILGALSCLLTWWLARQALRSAGQGGEGAAERAAFLAALLTGASFALTIQATSLNNEVPYTFLLLLISLSTFRVAQRRTLLGMVIMAALNGLAVLFRAEHTLLFVALMAYLLWRWRHRDGHAHAVATPRRVAWRSGAIGLATAVVVFFTVALPWNIRSYQAIRHFNTIEKQALDLTVARVPWTADAVAFLRELPAFAREGNFRRLDDVAAALNRDRVTREFVESWFREEQGYVPRPLSPWVFVSNQGALCFALANNALADGGFATSLLNVDGPGTLALGNPRHLRIFQRGYQHGGRYLLSDPAGTARLWARKLTIFGGGLTQGLTPFNWPLRAAGIRRAADQLSTPAGNVWLWPVGLYVSAVIGLVICFRRRIGAIFIIVLVYKLVVTLLFFGYVRQAASVLPFFLVLVAIGLDTVLVAPLVRRRPTLEAWLARLAALAVTGVIVASLYCGWRSVHYEIYGGIDRTPQWGTGAFESQQPLAVRVVFGPRE